jgi:hypothetical protein
MSMLFIGKPLEQPAPGKEQGCPLPVSLCIVARMAAVDDYLHGLDPPSRTALEHVQALVMDLVPDAEQGTKALRQRPIWVTRVVWWVTIVRGQKAPGSRNLQTDPAHPLRLEGTTFTTPDD